MLNGGSLNIPQLPLVFILSLSSPSEPSYLHAAYSRSTLALLHIRSVTVSSGVQMLEELLSQVRLRMFNKFSYFHSHP